MKELTGIICTFIVILMGLFVLIGSIYLLFPSKPETIRSGMIYLSEPYAPITVSDSIKAVDLRILELQLEREQFSLDSLRISEYKNVLFACLGSLSSSARAQRKWCEDRAKEFTRYQE